jgi:hypothetical protein
MIEDDGIFMSPKQVQQMFKISKPTELAWRKNRTLPKPLVMGRRVYYKSKEITNITLK